MNARVRGINHTARIRCMRGESAEPRSVSDRLQARMRLLVLESQLAADVGRHEAGVTGPAEGTDGLEQFRAQWEEIEAIRASLDDELPYPDGDASCLVHDEPVFGERNPPGPDDYLYHYTRAFTLPMIRKSRSLRFRSLKFMNDPHEAMDSRAFGMGLIGSAGDDLQLSPQDNETFVGTDWSAEINRIRRDIKVGCFSMDAIPDLAAVDPLAAAQSVPPRLYAHRGFAHPRMWSQYADDSCGVCIVLRRDDLESAVAEFVDGRWPWGHGAVDYTVAENELSLGFFDVRTLIRDGAHEALLNSYEESILTKHADWAHEAEFRFFVMDGAEGVVDVPITESAIEGVVLGPRFNSRKHLRYVAPFARDFEVVGRVRHLSWTHGRPELRRVVLPNGVRAGRRRLRSTRA